MKLAIAIVRDEFASDVNRALTEGGFSVTRISSTGGFWRRGYATLMIGVEDEDVDEALEIINRSAGPEPNASEAPPAHPPHRATIFVLNVVRFARY